LTHDLFDVLLCDLAAKSCTSLSYSCFHCQLFEHRVINWPTVQLTTTRIQNHGQTDMSSLSQFVETVR